jgi:hypothetical protein
MQYVMLIYQGDALERQFDLAQLGRNGCGGGFTEGPFRLAEGEEAKTRRASPPAAIARRRARCCGRRAHSLTQTRSKGHEARTQADPTIVLLPGLEAVSRSNADRSCRREGQKATLDDLEHQDQVDLPAAEVGCCLEYLLDDRNRHGQCRCEEEAAGHSNTVPLEVEDSYGYHHGVGPPYEKERDQESQR